MEPSTITIPELLHEASLYFVYRGWKKLASFPPPNKQEYVAENISANLKGREQ